MTPPDPRESLEKLVDRLNEQLNVLCSQSQEHLFLPNLIDVRTLTDMTRTMLKDAKRRLADCRRHPVPPSNRPFLVTITDPYRPRRIVETHEAQARTRLYSRVSACAALGVFAVSLGYALHENRVAQSLATQNEQELASLNDTRRQLDSLKATVNALDAGPEPDPAADTTIVEQTASHRQRTGGSGRKHLQLPLHIEHKVVKERRSNLPAARADLRSAGTQPTGSIAPGPNEFALSQKKGEHNYYEFDIDKSKQFQKEGPLGIRLKKANTKRQYADLELMVNDQNLFQKHVNLYQPVMSYGPDSSQPVEVVIDNISKDRIHGYVKLPEHRQSELVSRPSDTLDPLQLRSVAPENQRANGRWHGFSMKKILSRVKLRSDS